MRASDEDRQRAVDELRRHCAAGRIDVDEYASRLERALAAPTLEELDEIRADLPMLRVPEPAGGGVWAPGGRRSVVRVTPGGGGAGGPGAARARATAVALAAVTVAVVVALIVMAVAAEWVWAIVLVVGWAAGLVQGGLLQGGLLQGGLLQRRRPGGDRSAV